MHRDGFGRLCVDPAALSRVERIRELRRLAGRLQADDDRATAWVGHVLARWLRDGGDLAALFGVRAPRGSHATPVRMIEREHRDRLLVRFAGTAGGDALALRILRNATACPPELREQADELRRLGVPLAHDAVSRARRRLAADRA